MSTEPVAIGTAVQTLASAIIAVLVGFEIVHWSAEQVGLVLAALTAVIVVIGAVTRSKVSPTGK